MPLAALIFVTMKPGGGSINRRKRARAMRTALDAIVKGLWGTLPG
jgi:hypothetical protein